MIKDPYISVINLDKHAINVVFSCLKILFKVVQKYAKTCDYSINNRIIVLLHTFFVILI